MTKLGYDDGFYLVIEQPNEKIKAPVAPFYASIPMDPDIPEEPETPETGRITVMKHSAKSQDLVLGGAAFQVYRLAGAGETPTTTIRYNEQDVGIVPATIDEQAVIITTGADGIGTSAELPLGLYFLIETQAPAGCYLTEQPVAVFVTATSHEVTNAEKISNLPGIQLPETGGPGTWMFTFSGTLLCTGAVTMLLRKKRRYTE